MKPENLKVIISLFVLAVLIFGLLLGKAEAVRKSKGRNLIYILLAGICLGLTGFVRFLGLSDNTVVYFIVLQALMLVLGIIHVGIYAKSLRWPSRESFVPELLLTLNTALSGAIFLMLALVLMQVKNFGTLLLSSLIWFMVPFFFTKAMDWYQLIPRRIFKTWSYPLDKPLPDPTDQELASPMVISFEFQKKISQDDFTSFRAKAPKDIQFGKLFYFFINDYNSRHPESTIEVAAKSGAFPWVFHFKPKWFAKTRYLDPDETVFHNQIRENSIIVCQRIIEN